MFRQTTINLVAFIMLSTAAGAETLFCGVLNVTAVTPACTNEVSINDNSNAQFHPADVAGNSNFSALNQIDRYSAHSLKLLAPGSFTDAFQQTSNVSIGWSDYTPDKPSFLLVSKQMPSTLTTTTPNVTLVGQIKNPYGDTGFEACVETFIFVGFNQQQ